MYYYRVANCCIGSERRFPELLALDSSAGVDFRFTVGAAQSLAWPLVEDCYHHRYAHDGNPWLSLAERGGEITFQFWKQATFLLNSVGNEISCSPDSNITQDTIRHLFLDHVLPLLLSTQASVVLHGSAVATSKGAVLFLGPSGSGKSSQAAAFLDFGAMLIADDFCLIDAQHRVWPSYPALRLWPGDSERSVVTQSLVPTPVSQHHDKELLRLDNANKHLASEPLAVVAMYALGDADSGDTAPRISRLDPREGFITLVRESFLLHNNKPTRVANHFESVRALLSAVSLREVVFEKTPASYKLVPEAIKRDLDG